MNEAERMELEDRARRFRDDVRLYLGRADNPAYSFKVRRYWAERAEAVQRLVEETERKLNVEG